MRDARLLMAHAHRIPTARLAVIMQDAPNVVVIMRFQVMMDKRLERQPVSQILGKREFWGREFAITPDVLDPRPDTELLIETALEYPFKRILDLGTGSGCILLTLLRERPDASGVGTDISTKALEIALKNAETLYVKNRADLIKSDWFENVTGSFDMILTNPPYVTAEEYETLSPEVRNWEPKNALTPGGDGLSAYNAIVAQAAQYLNPQGLLLAEIGMTQGKAVKAIFQSAGFVDCAIKTDLNTHDRVVLGRLP